MQSKLEIYHFILLATSITCSYACSCMMQHPQTHYCSADFVILARIRKAQIIPTTYSKVYKVRVKKEFKISEKGLVALKSGRIHTPMYDSSCRAELTPGQLYVISGRINSLRAHTTLCDMNMEWKQVTKRQKKGLRLLYKRGCTCDIQNCRFSPRCYRRKDSCIWKSQCESKYGICLRQTSGSCRWNKNKMILSGCKSEPQQTKNNSRIEYGRSFLDSPQLIP